MEALDIKQARKIALFSQDILSGNRAGKPIEATQFVVQHLGYIQIDTISVIQRAHHHTLWSRNSCYEPAHLDSLLQRKKVFEYWSHAAAYLPIEDYRMCLPEMERIKQDGSLWFKADPKVKAHVLERIRLEGPLRSKDFRDNSKSKPSMWQWKPAKIALETLFMEGELMVTQRLNFQKVYDLRERVLGNAVDTTFPSRAEAAEFLINRYLTAHGLGTALEIAYLRKGIKSDIEVQLVQMKEDGKLIECAVAGVRYYARPEVFRILNHPLARSRLKILSPFDNLVIQRKRIRHLFNFDYQIECYLPANKRRYGYFCLPVLWNAQLAARIDCKANRKEKTLVVKNIFLEPTLKRRDEFCAALKKEIMAFMTFNDCSQTRVELAPDIQITNALQYHAE